MKPCFAYLKTKMHNIDTSTIYNIMVYFYTKDTSLSQWAFLVISCISYFLNQRFLLSCYFFELVHNMGLNCKHHLHLFLSYDAHETNRSFSCTTMFSKGFPDTCSSVKRKYSHNMGHI